MANCNPSQIQSLVLQMLKAAKVPFIDPCTGLLTGDCNDTCGTGGGGVSVSTTINPQVTVTLFLTAGAIVSLGAICGDAQSTISGSSKTYLEVVFLGV